MPPAVIGIVRLSLILIESAWKNVAVTAPAVKVAMGKLHNAETMIPIAIQTSRHAV